MGNGIGLGPSQHSPTSSKLVQCVSLTIKQVLIDYGPLVPNNPLRDKSIEAQHALRGMFNDWIDIKPPSPLSSRRGEPAPLQSSPWHINL